MWDELLVFGPFTTRQHIIEQIPGIDGSGIPEEVTSDDGHCWLVFLSKREVVTTYLVERAILDFTTISSLNATPISPDTARLVIESRETWHFAHLIDEALIDQKLETER